MKMRKTELSYLHLFTLLSCLDTFPLCPVTIAECLAAI